MTEAAISRTVAFIADPRAPLLFLKETVTTLAEKHEVDHALVDLSTIPGVNIAAALHSIGIAFEHLDFGQKLPDTTTAKASKFRPRRQQTLHDLPYLKSQSVGTLVTDIDDLGDLNANLVIVPTMADQTLMDLSQDTVVGQVLNQIESKNRNLLLIAPPERGLRSVADPQEHTAAEDEAYERLTLLIQPDAIRPQPSVPSQE